MVVCDISAYQEDDVGLLDIIIGARRTIAAERSLVAGDGARHAKSGIAVVVVGSNAELDQFTEGVKFLRHQLPSTDDSYRAWTTSPLDGAELIHHSLERRVPGDPFKSST